MQVTFSSVNENSVTLLTIFNYLEENKVAASEKGTVSDVSALHK